VRFCLGDFQSKLDAGYSLKHLNYPSQIEVVEEANEL